MGQKSNPNILRLFKTNNWNSNYIEKKSNEFYLHTSKDLEIRKLIYLYFKKKKIIIKKCKINFINNTLLLYITYHQSTQSGLLLKKLNRAQKIRFKKLFRKRKIIFKKKPLKKALKKKIYKKKKLKKKILNLEQKRKNKKKILKIVKNSYNYESFDNKIKQKKNAFLRILKTRRLKRLDYYKKFLHLNAHKTIKNKASNHFLEPLFQSLRVFYPRLYTINLILMPLNNSILQYLKNNSKKKQLELKKLLAKLRRFSRNEFFKDGANIAFSLFVNNNSAELLSKYIVLTLKKLKRHKFFLRFLKKILGYFFRINTTTDVKGIKIQVKGRINGASRAKFMEIKIGKHMPVLTLNSLIDYSENTIFTSNGTLGVKIWICEKSKKKNVERTEKVKIQKN